MSLQSTLKRKTVLALDRCVSAIYKPPNIAGKEETLRRIIDEGCSIARFGDGDLGLILGVSEGYQTYDPALAERLKAILQRKDNDRLLIGVSKSIYTGKLYYYSKYRVRYLPRIHRLLDKHKQYYETNISRFYHTSEDGKKELAYIQRVKQIWEGRDLVVIEGEKTRMGVGNDLFDNAKRVRRILCPAENAFFHYDEILSTILAKVPQDELVLLALGPTATILAYDLFHKGYQAVDIGHVDISYEWYLRGVRDPSGRIIVPGKYTNEAKGGSIVDDCRDPKYISEIIARVGLDQPAL